MRGSSLNLARVAVELSDRDRAVLAMIGAHRFLTARQVEAFCFTGHATALAATRATSRTLRRLHHTGLLGHLNRRVGGVRAGSAGYVWHLTSAGQRLLDPDTARRVHEPSSRLLGHYLAVADTHLHLRAAAAAGWFELVEVALEPRAWRRFLGSGSEPRWLKPDLYVITASGDFEDHWFIEIDLGTEHPATVLGQCRAYLDYRTSGTEQARHGLFPRVVWQVPTAVRADRLQTAFTAARLDPALFRITSPDGLADLLSGGAQ